LKHAGGASRPHFENKITAREREEFDMKKFFKGVLGLVIVLAVLTVIFPQQALHAAQSVGEQALLKMRFGQDLAQAQGNGILQTGEVNSISAAVATASTTQAVAITATGNTFIRGIFVEKSTGAAGSYTISVGTGTNCGTGNVVVLGPVINPLIGYAPIGVPVPTAGQAVCLATDAGTTSVRLLYD
jgi:hypothetical protein